MNARSRRLLPLFAVALSLAFVPPAGAKVTSVFKGAVSCKAQAGGVTFCGSVKTNGKSTPARTLARSWDGTAVDVNLALPKGGVKKPGLPLVMIFHGYGGSKIALTKQGGGIANPYDSLKAWTDRGYAAFSMSDRGFGESCGTKASRNSVPKAACAKGYNHLLDTRYEVRDAQYLAGLLVDEGIVAPRKIAAIGGSYGGGMSMALAALRDRTMLPNGKLTAWKSAKGTKLRLAAAAPAVPWTDLAYSLVPNGGTLDYVEDAPYTGPVGVMKQSYVNTLYAAGCDTPTTYCTKTKGSEWNLDEIRKLLLAGEPYPATVGTQLENIKKYHSSYYIDSSQPPAPLLIQNGWTDDLFPVDEAIRYYNRTRAKHPSAPVSLFFADVGHPRAQNKAADISRQVAAVTTWLDHYVKGAKKKPFQGVTAFTETCPATAASGGPFTASSWASLSPGEVRLTDAADHAVSPGANDPAIGPALDAVGGKACTTVSGADQVLAATYSLDVSAPFTLMGSPTVVADIGGGVADSQLAARLLDVAPDGTATLVARGLWRPALGGDPAQQVFQLHPNGWRFEAGHKAKLELLPDDAPYGRPSNAFAVVVVRNLELRLPVTDAPGSTALVQAPAAKVVPAGMKLAPGY